MRDERLAVSFTIIYYTNAHLPHAREFSAYARECITRKLSVASGPGLSKTTIPDLGGRFIKLFNFLCQ